MSLTIKILKVDELWIKLTPLLKSDFKMIQTQVRDITDDCVKQIPYYHKKIQRINPNTPKIGTSVFKTPEKTRQESSRCHNQRVIRKLNFSEGNTNKISLNKTPIKTLTQLASSNTPSTCSSQKNSQESSNSTSSKVKRKLRFTPQKHPVKNSSGIGSQTPTVKDSFKFAQNIWEFQSQPTHIEPEILFGSAMPEKVPLSNIFIGENWKLEGYRSSEEGFW